MSMFASGPAENAYVITPNSLVDIATASRALYIGSGGDLVVDMAGTGESVTFANVAPGSVLPISVTRVYATSTAADIVALV